MANDEGIPDGWVRQCVDRIVEATKWMVDKVGALLMNAVAPIQLAAKSFLWVPDVQKPMTELAANIAPSQLISEEYWEGLAYRAYLKAVDDQPGAATAIASIGGGMATQLLICAAAGLLAYVGMGVLIVQFIATLIASAAGVASVVFSWAGIAAAAADTFLTAAAAAAIIGGLVAILTATGEAMLAMRSSMANFPGADWPDGTK